MVTPPPEPPHTNIARKFTVKYCQKKTNKKQYFNALWGRPLREKAKQKTSTLWGGPLREKAKRNIEKTKKTKKKKQYFNALWGGPLREKAKKNLYSLGRAP